MRFATWNVKAAVHGNDYTDKAVAIWDELRRCAVDVVALQEVPAALFTALDLVAPEDWWTRHSLGAVDVTRHRPGNFWGVAMLGRAETCHVDSAAVIGDPDNESGAGLFWRRTLAVSTAIDEQPVTLANIHVRPGASVNMQKLAFIRRISSWLTHAPRPLLLGIDANSAGDATSWQRPEGDDETTIWGQSPPHGLVNAWWTRPDYKDVTTVQIRGRRACYDHIWYSNEWTVNNASSDWRAAERAASDHALVYADVSLGGSDR